MALGLGSLSLSAWCTSHNALYVWHSVKSRKRNTQQVHAIGIYSWIILSSWCSTHLRWLKWTFLLLLLLPKGIIYKKAKGKWRVVKCIDELAEYIPPYYAALDGGPAGLREYIYIYIYIRYMQLNVTRYVNRRRGGSSSVESSSIYYSARA